MCAFIIIPDTKRYLPVFEKKNILIVILHLFVILYASKKNDQRLFNLGPCAHLVVGHSTIRSLNEKANCSCIMPKGTDRTA